VIPVNQSFDDMCQRLLDAFFTKFPDEQLRGEAFGVLLKLLSCNTPLLGKPGGWAAGIVYAMGSRGVGVPGVLNSELEEAFGVSMSTIYKRAARVRELVGL